MPIVFDTETTGFIKSMQAPLNTQPKIIELYAAKVDHSFNMVEELELLIDPRETLSEEIIKVTGLKDDDLRGKGSFSSHALTIANFWLGERFVPSCCDML